MKSKLPIIRAALEAGLTLQFNTRDFGDFLSELEGEAESQQPWIIVEKHLPCSCYYSEGYFTLEGIPKLEAAPDVPLLDYDVVKVDSNEWQVWTDSYPAGVCIGHGDTEQDAKNDAIRRVWWLIHNIDNSKPGGNAES